MNACYENIGYLTPANLDSFDEKFGDCSKFRYSAMSDAVESEIL